MELEFPETQQIESVPAEVLEKVPSLTDEQWTMLRQIIIDAEGIMPQKGSGPDKKRYVTRWLSQVWEGIEPIVVSLAIEAGVSYLKRFAKI